jgi:hypothetical protein
VVIASSREFEAHIHVVSVVLQMLCSSIAVVRHASAHGGNMIFRECTQLKRANTIPKRVVYRIIIYTAEKRTVPKIVERG